MPTRKKKGGDVYVNLYFALRIPRLGKLIAEKRERCSSTLLYFFLLLWCSVL